VGPPSSIATALLVRAGELANRTFVLPVLVFYPTSRCNSRCVSCDWWRSSGADDLSLEEIDALAHALPELGTRVVVFSGGEPLLRPDVFEAAQTFRARGLTLHLVTSGVLLERSVTDVAQEFSRVVVSLDAATEELYRAIRGIPALKAIERGITRLRAAAPDVAVVARATVHRMNFRELPALIEQAKSLGLDGVSFRPADMYSSAFGRQRTPQPEALALNRDEVAELGAIVDGAVERYGDDIESGFVADSAAKLRWIVRYYAALVDGVACPPLACNAPYTSIVVEADGSVRPCYFHEVIGNVRRTPLESIVRSDLPGFRRDLDVRTNEVCGRCVFSARTTWRDAPWR